MIKGFYNVPFPVNEPVLSYASGTPERENLQKAYDEMWGSQIEIPMVIGGEKITTGNLQRVMPPHDHQHNVGSYHYGEAQHVKDAIKAALDAK
ncbi:MAG TPA: 1-pyrroline-5-carboxylate dehydrogenase, partial [Cryomorphaceae bacterium]|nr:1-pyrroline-5-carboxylate dehydrogenase [Cryomorphaceae bacterium]